MPPDVCRGPDSEVSCAIVLAGGLGTRLRPAVPDLPKPMAPVEGEPFLAHLLDHWISKGIRSYVLAVGYRRDAIQAHFGDQWHGADIRYAIESHPLGTGGALRLAARHIDPGKRFLLLNGDTFFDVDLAALASVAQGQDADWCFSLFSSADSERYLGMEMDVDGRIRSIDSHSPTPRLVNGGVYVVHPRSLGGLTPGPASLESDLFPRFLACGQRFFGVESTGRFIDIGVPADYDRAAAILCQGRQYPASSTIIAAQATPAHRPQP